MGVIGLDHIQLAIPVGGEDKARRFFLDLLGMKEVPKPSSLSPNGCWFTAGSVNLHIGIEADFKPALKAHPAFVVDNFDALRRALTSAGHPMKTDKPLPGVERFFTEDPFGNRIEIIQG